MNQQFTSTISSSKAMPLSSTISRMQSTISSNKGLKSRPVSGTTRRVVKHRFEDEAEEAKYISYRKHVRMLNKMKEYLGSMHKSMSKEVVKRLAVSIKRMEQDLIFYENNWHLFQSPNLDYVKGIIDLEDSEMQSEH